MRQQGDIVKGVGFRFTFRYQVREIGNYLFISFACAPALAVASFRVTATSAAVEDCQMAFAYAARTGLRNVTGTPLF
jgi:hypothetical protein